jgi:hypothetical protein
VDDYFWVPTEPPYQQQRDSSARLSLLLADLAKAPQSVTAGSVINWGWELEESFSLTVFLTLPPELRIARLGEREAARFGRADPKFLESAAQYDEGSLDVNSRMGDESRLSKRSCLLLRIEGDISVQERVTRVTAALSNLHLQPTASAAAEVRRLDGFDNVVMMRTRLGGRSEDNNN